MMTLDECIAAARLPISVRYVPGRYGVDGVYVGYVKGSAMYTWDNEAAASYRICALRTRLSEQQGEKR